MSQMSQIHPIIKKIIDADTDTFVIFFIYECPYSMKALDFMKDRNLKYKGYNINSINGGMSRLLQILNQNASMINFDPKHKTKPIIFVNGQFVGGFQDLQRLVDNH